MRRDYSVESSEAYLINPQQLRDLGLELIRRDGKNAYKSHREYKHLSPEERAGIYTELKDKIEREGFRRDLPIIVMLLRKDGKKDRILQGHHRLSIALELGLEEVPVRFVC
jgi:ParB-like chromosome segregation protein Spo0J